MTHLVAHQARRLRRQRRVNGLRLAPCHRARLHPQPAERQAAALTAILVGGAAVGAEQPTRAPGRPLRNACTTQNFTMPNDEVRRSAYSEEQQRKLDGLMHLDKIAASSSTTEYL